jgi:preprotein translocase subunit SecE
MGPNKFITMIYLVGGLLLAFLLTKVGDWVWSYFDKPKELVINGAALAIAGITTWALYKNERVHTAAVEVSHELEKVTWPSRKETYAATIVVLVTVAIASVILTVFDFAWSRLTGLLVG